MITFYHDIEQNIDSNADPEKCRQIVKEYLKLEKKYAVFATYNVVGKLFQEQPDLIEWILKEGQEVAFHSYNHRVDWQPNYYVDEIDLCRKVSNLPCGYRSPYSEWNKDTLRALWEKGFLWSAENDPHQEPYFIYNGLVRLPIAADDGFLHRGDISVKGWVQQFLELLQKRHYFGFGTHDYITSFSPEERLRAYEKLLQIAVENRALLVTFSEAADLYRRAALSRYFSITSKKWNRYNVNIYRTRRFRELIRIEAEKLDQPVVADLGSGGGLFSKHLRDVAKRIYCVDNASGMIDDITSDSCIMGYLGEVTDSNLLDNSIDFVICARTIEYLFWPERLADEIKRIGKMGATFFVTFPALRETPPKREREIPDQIRHYFTPVEIRKWASQIGAGLLIGIEYEETDPESPEAEQRYRKIEQNPSGRTPLNWVYIGVIQKKITTKNYRKTIPFSIFNFHYLNLRRVRFEVYLIELGKRFIPKPIRKLIKKIIFR